MSLGPTGDPPSNPSKTPSKQQRKQHTIVHLVAAKKMGERYDFICEMPSGSLLVYRRVKPLTV